MAIVQIPFKQTQFVGLKDFLSMIEECRKSWLKDEKEGEDKGRWNEDLMMVESIYDSIHDKRIISFDDKKLSWLHYELAFFT